LEAEEITAADLARALAQRSQFHQRHTRAELEVRRLEIRLRNMLGLPPQPTVPLIPSELPLREFVPLSVPHAVATALERRPELIQRQLAVEMRDQELVMADNAVKPRLDLFAQFRIQGLSDRLDDSLDQAASLDYTDWTLGSTYAVPFGNRAARSLRRYTELRAARERAILHQARQNVQYEIEEQIAAIQAAWRQYELAQRRVDETHEWLQVSRTRFTQPPPTETPQQDLLTVLLVDYQQALQLHLDAVIDAAELLAEYNALHAQLEALQGTLLERRQVWLTVGPAAP
jgi:outer membrane protein TolC